MKSSQLEGISEDILIQIFVFSPHIMPRHSVEDRAKVHIMWEQGKTWDEIKTAVHGSNDFVRRWHKQEGSYDDKPRSGRPAKLSAADIKVITKTAIGKLHQSTRKVAEKVTGKRKARGESSASQQTVMRALRQIGTSPYHRRKKPRIMEAQADKRVEFATEHKDDDFSLSVFVDEKHWQPYSAANRKNDIVWATDPSKVPVMQVMQQGPTVRTIGALTRNGLTRLVLYEGGLKAAKYQEILEDFLIPDVNELLEGENWRLIQDGAPPHSAKSTQEFLEDNVPDFIRAGKFPPNSPDLNPIDNLWGTLLSQVQQRSWRSLEGFKRVIQQEWKSVTSAQCVKLVDSMRSRCLEVIKKRGCPTHY
jgi:transposase